MKMIAEQKPSAKQDIRCSGFGTFHTHFPDRVWRRTASMIRRLVAETASTIYSLTPDAASCSLFVALLRADNEILSRNDIVDENGRCITFSCSFSFEIRLLAASKGIGRPGDSERIEPMYYLFKCSAHKTVETLLPTLESSPTRFSSVRVACRCLCVVCSFSLITRFNFLLSRFVAFALTSFHRIVSRTLCSSEPAPPSLLPRPFAFEHIVVGADDGVDERLTEIISRKS